MALPRPLRLRSLFNPFTRVAIATFAWNHRHEILRWGRSLYEQVVGRSDLSPRNALRTGRVLVAIASDSRIRDARELRRVSLRDGVVDLDVDDRWRELPRLVERLRGIDGIDAVRVNHAADPGAHTPAADRPIDRSEAGLLLQPGDGSRRGR
jgi:hypothetical protein